MSHSPLRTIQLVSSNSRAGFNSKDGTAAFYGVAPTFGYVAGDANQRLGDPNR